MSELSSESQPQLVVNSEQQKEQQDESNASSAAAVEGQIASVGLNDKDTEGSIPADKETQAKVQSIFQQVRHQIRTQMGMKVPKTSILELVQKVRDREPEMASVSSEPDVKNSSDEEKKVEVPSGKCRGEAALKEEELASIFAKELEFSKNSLREEFKEQLCELRKEMQAYTEQALKDMECKMQSWQSCHLEQANHQLEKKGSEKKAKSSAAPSLASRKGRVLTRTMTTIIPKTCAPIIMGPRAKSETLSSSKNSSQLLLRDADFSVFSSAGSRLYQSRRPLPPPGPPLHHRQKLVRTKAQTGN